MAPLVDVCALPVRDLVKFEHLFSVGEGKGYG